MYGACPRPTEERAGCPWASRPRGCYSDSDHIVPRKYANFGLVVQKYIETPDNKQQICRWEHDEKTKLETPELIPSQDFMLAAIYSAYEAGKIGLSDLDYTELFGDDDA